MPHGLTMSLREDEYTVACVAAGAEGGDIARANGKAGHHLEVACASTDLLVALP
ncbi:hypothetical protein E2562_005833, partial [Oryza meyeriana var. granulata]